MAEETRVIKVKVEGVDEARRQLEELKRLRDELSAPIRAQTTAAGGGSIISPATGMPFSAAGAGAGSMAGGSFVPRTAGMSATGGELAAASEQVVAQLANEVRSSMAGAAQRFAQGQPIGGGLSTSRPAASGATGMAAMPRMPSIIPAMPVEGGMAAIQAAAASLMAEGVMNASAMQIRERVGQLRAQASGTSTLMPTGTGGAAEVMPGNVTPMRARGGSGGGRGGGGGGGGGGRGGGIGDGPTDMAPEWWLGGGGTEAEWAQFDVFNARKRVTQARAAMAGKGGRQQGPLEESVMGSFQPAMLGLTFQFGIMPLRQQLDPAMQAAEQFGPPDPARTAASQRLQAARIRLGQQASGAQARWEDMGANIMGKAADLNLGGPAQDAGNLGQTVGDIATAWSPALLAGYLGKRALWAIGPGLKASGSAAIGAGQAGLAALGGVGAGGVAAGLGMAGVGLAGVAGGAGVVSLAEQQLGQTSLAPLVGAVRPMLQAFAPQLGPVAGPVFAGGAHALDLWDAVNGRPRFTGASSRDATADPDAFIGPPVATTRSRIAWQAARTALPGGALDIAEEQELAGRAQTEASNTMAGIRLGISDQSTALGQRRFAQDQLRVSRRFDEDYQWAGDDLATNLTRRKEDIRIGAGRARRDLRTNVGRSNREIGIGEGENEEDINMGFRRGLQDIALGQVGGIGGDILRLGIGRRRALADSRRGAQRARGRVGRSAGDAGEDINTGEGRAVDDADTAVRDAKADLDKGYGRGRGRLDEDQALGAQRAAEDAALQLQLRQLVGKELELRKNLNTEFAALATNQVQIYKDFNAALKAAGDKAASDLAGMFEGYDR